MPQRVDALLFDLDGTLLDTAQDMGNALNRVLNDHQRQAVTYQQYRNIASDGAKGMLTLGFGDDFNQHNALTLRQAFLAYYAQDISTHTGYFAGIESLLTTLNARGLPWGIVTNKPAALTTQLLNYFPLLNNCAVVVCGDTLEQRKPHPAPLQLAAKSLNIAEQKIAYVGDAKRDMEAANAANMTAIVARYGYISDLSQISQWPAHLRIDHPAELLALC